MSGLRNLLPVVALLGSALPLCASGTQVPVAFEENRGQLDARVRYVARGAKHALFVTDRDTVLQTPSGSLRLQLLGACPQRPPHGEELLPGVVNSYLGNRPSGWRAGVSRYGSVRVPGVYPGIDLVYHSAQGPLELDWRLAPGADPRRIRLRVDGARSLAIGADGDLVATLREGELRIGRPVVTQRIHGEETAVEGRFVRRGTRTVGVQIGPYDRSAELVIDPLLVFSGVYGGTGTDGALAVARDAAGNLYVTGATASTNFPTTAGVAQTTLKGSQDAFVAKLAPDGTLLYSTYLGGTLGEVGYAIGVDAGGNAVLAGSTLSGDFPTTAGVLQQAYGGTGSGSSFGGDGFAARLGPTGALLFGTYLGGSLGDIANGVAVDASGNAYVAGSTKSQNFPTTQGSLRPTAPFPPGSSDQFPYFSAFVTKLNPSGVAVYSTYLGGTHNSGVGTIVSSRVSVAVDASGAAYVCGATPDEDFPATGGAFQFRRAGTTLNADVFVAKLAPAGNQLLYATYLGGSEYDIPIGLAIDAAGNAYVAGSTPSTNFPTTPGSYHPTYSGGRSDLFVSKLSPTGGSLLYSTFLGGTREEGDTSIFTVSGGIGVDAAGRAWVTASTTSSDFPVTADASQPIFATAGIYRTTNGGASWSVRDFGLARSPFGLAVNPKTPSILYAGVNGMAKSTDAGASWFPVNNGIPLFISSPISVSFIAIDPVTPTTVYAAADFNGVLKSADSGGSWSLLTSGLPASSIQFADLVIDPLNPATVYAAARDALYKSTNGGATWSSASNGLPTGTNSLFGLAIDAAVPQSLYLGTKSGVFKSINGGGSWTSASVGLPVSSPATSSASDVEIDAGSPLTLYTVMFVDGGFFKSTDAGNTWKQARTGIAANYIPSELFAAPGRPGTLYISSTFNTGSYRSTDGGETWARADTGLGGIQTVRLFAGTAAEPDTFYGLMIVKADGFVSVLNETGSGLAFSTFLGGGDDDFSNGIVIDGTGAAVAGQSSSRDFPRVGSTRTNAGQSDAFVSRFGEGPALTLTPSSQAFGSVDVGSSADRTFTVRNAGTGTLTGTAATSAPFGIVSGGSLSLGAGQSQDVVVRFSPTAVGAASGTLTVTSNGGSGSASLSGTGTQPAGPALSVAPPSLSFGTVGVGATADLTLTVSNSGVGTLTGSVTTSAPFSILSGGSFSLGAGQSQTVTVRFRPDANRAFTGSAAFTSNGGSLTVALTGTGEERGATVVVPIVLIAAGLNDSSFISELTLTDRGSADTDILLTYTASFGGGSGTASDRLQAGRQKVIPNAIDYLRGLGVPIPATGNRGGTLAVKFQTLSSPSDGAATVRTTALVPEGRAGLAYSGLSTTRASSASRRAPLGAPALGDGVVYVGGLRQNAVDRSNVAFVHAGSESDGTLVLKMSVISGDPAAALSVSFPDVVLSPGAFFQLSGILGLNGLNLSNGYVKVERLSGRAPYYAYGVINDQLNSDGSFVPPLAAADLVGRAGLTLPVAVEAGAFSTELVAGNFGSAARTLRLRFIADAIQAAGNTAEASLTLAPGEQRIVPDFLQFLRDRGAPVPKGPSYAGAVFATVDGGDVSDVFLGARTSAPGSKGRYGLFYTAVPQGGAATGEAWIYGLQQDATNRTNVAMINTGEVDGSTDVFTLDIYDGATGARVKSLEGQTLGSRRWFQFTTLLQQQAPGTAQGYLKITRTAGNNPFIAYAVVNDGGKPGERSGDGAYLLMDAGPTAVLATSASSLSFGSVNVGQTKDLTLTVRNTGAGTLSGTATVIAGLAALVGTPFSVMPATFSVPSGGAQDLVVRFAPTEAGNAGGSLALSSNGGNASIGLSGSAVAAVPVLDVEPLSLDFGTVTVGAVKDLTATIKNPGTAPLIVSGLSTGTGIFGVASPAVLPFTVEAGAQRDLTVRFAPAVTGPASAVLNITGNDPVHPVALVTLEGTGQAGGGGSTLVLGTDDGTDEIGFGIDDLIMVNRFTPPSYPVTLRKLRIYVYQYQNSPDPSGATITLVFFKDPAGGTQPPASHANTITQTFTLPTIPASGLVDFDIDVAGAPVITSGDFYLGFRAPTPYHGVVFPADVNGTQQRRGFFSRDGGATYQSLGYDQGGGNVVPVNLVVRAVVSVP